MMGYCMVMAVHTCKCACVGLFFAEHLGLRLVNVGVMSATAHVPPLCDPSFVLYKCKLTHALARASPAAAQLLRLVGDGGGDGDGGGGSFGGEDTERKVSSFVLDKEQVRTREAIENLQLIFGKG